MPVINNIATISDPNRITGGSGGGHGGSSSSGLTNPIDIANLGRGGTLATPQSAALFTSAGLTNPTDIANLGRGGALLSASAFSPTTPNADQATSSNQTGEKISLSPSLNALGSVDQATYSVKFSLMSDDPNNLSEIVIVETGKTNLNIQSLVIEAQPPGNNGRNTPAASIEL